MCNGEKDTADAANASKLLDKMKRTKSNRFNFASRLKTQSDIKSVALNYISLISIVLSICLLTYADSISPGAARFFGFMGASVSVASLILSLQNPVSDLARRANDAHRCAREISNLYGKLEFGAIDPTKARIEYEALLNSYENHEEIDNKKTLYERSEDFPRDAKGITWSNSVVPYWISAHVTVLSSAVMIAVVVAIWFSLPLVEGYLEDASAAESASGMQK